MTYLRILKIPIHIKKDLSSYHSLPEKFVFIPYRATAIQCVKAPHG